MGPSYIGSPPTTSPVVVGNYMTNLKVVVEGKNCITSRHKYVVITMVHSVSQPKRTDSAVLTRLLMKEASGV